MKKVFSVIAVMVFCFMVPLSSYADKIESGSATANANAGAVAGAVAIAGGGAGGAGGEGGNAFATGGLGIGMGGSSSAKVGDISNKAEGGAVIGSGNSAVGNGIGNFSPSAKVGDVTATGGSAKIEKGAVVNDVKNTVIVAPVQSTKVDVENKNTNLNLNVQKSDIDVKNKIDVDNKNVNKNTATSDQDQKQKQKQTQTQTQSNEQGQSQSANNEGVVQINNYEADKRELINAPPVPAVDPKLSNGKAGAIKTRTSLWDNMTSIKKAQVSTVLNGAGGGTLMGPKASVTVRAITEKDFQTDQIRLETKKPAGIEYLGTIFAYSEGADTQALEALAIREAMKLGGTHIVFVERDSQVHADGSAWSIGIGGGASMFVKGDDIGVAPSGGLGFSGAKAYNESLPQLVFFVYHDSSLIVTGSMKK